MSDKEPQDADQAPSPSARQRSARQPDPGAAPPKPPAGFAAFMGDIQRLREIAGVLARHGFARLIRRGGLEKILGDRFPSTEGDDAFDPADPRGTSRRLRKALEELGATFIKLGQILSTRPDLLPQVTIREFEKLQDRVEPLGFDQVRAQIEHALGGSLEDLFDEVSPTPLATASIGQVHQARTLQGHKVVVKVLRPGIAAQIRADLDILYFLSRVLQATIVETDIYNVAEIVAEFDRAISQEIDFLNEARNLRRFKALHEGNPHVIIPEVVDALSCQTVLTLEFIEGRRISDIEPGCPEAQRLIGLLLDEAYEQIFIHGLFHADPHPGNLLITDEGKIALLDLGLVGQLSRAQQDDLVTLVLTLINGDIDGIARTILRMGHPQGRVDLSALKREIARLRDLTLNRHLDEIDVSAFTMDLMDAALRFRIKLNSEYSLLVKSTVTLEGVMRRLHPKLDLTTAAQPIARRLLTDRYNSKRLIQTLFTGALSLSGFLNDVPAQLDQVLMDLESGTVTVNVRNQQVDRLGADLSAIGTRLFLGLLSAGLIVGASVLFASAGQGLVGLPLLTIGAGIMLGAACLIAFWALAWPMVRKRLGPVRLSPLIGLIKRLF